MPSRAGTKTRPLGTNLAGLRIGLLLVGDDPELTGSVNARFRIRATLTMRVSLVHSETYARRKLERPGTARTKHLCHSTGGLAKSWGQQIAASTGKVGHVKHIKRLANR